MTRYYSKRNKRKVWAKTYGKPFIARRAVASVKAAMAIATSQQHLSAIAATAPNVGLLKESREVKSAMVVADTAIAIAKIINEGNKGFAK